MNSRRQFLRAGFTGASALALSACISPSPLKTQATVAVVGGGFAGASAARTVKELAPDCRVVLFEPNPVYTCCPFSNLVIAGLRNLSAQQFGYTELAASGVSVVHQRVDHIDPILRRLTLDDGPAFQYDKLIMAPGISFRSTLPGYDAGAAELMPHAWRAGRQTTLLRDQLHAMPDGGTFVMAIPAAPYRCPPGPYERASLVAHYLKANNPRAKVLLLDAKDRFSKMPLFLDGWRQLYGSMIEWQGEAEGANVIEVDASTKTLHTDFEAVHADVANVIPPQQAGTIATRAGVTDATGWCPVDATTFSSTLQNDIHVIGDAAVANAMPKSAFAANAQAKLCALQVVRALDGEPPVSSKLINTCYSLVSPNYGISVAGVYAPQGQRWQSINGAGGVSPLHAEPSFRAAEAGYAADWFTTITREVFG